MQKTIKIRGARAGGLAAVDMDLPLGKVICFTGRCSGGRRAMALDVLYAESRRRYMHALAPVEREGVSGAAQVDVDEVSGLPPAIYLGTERRGRTLGDYLQLEGILIQLALDYGQLHCGDCGGVCRGYEAADVEAAAARRFANGRCLILAPLQLRSGADWPGVWRELRQAGFLRVMIGAEVVRLDSAELEIDAEVKVVVDRLVPTTDSSVRFLEAVRVSRSISSGQTLVQAVDSGDVLHLNQQPTCGECGRQYDELAAEDFAPGRLLLQKVSLYGRTIDELQTMPMAAVRAFALEAIAAGHSRDKIVDTLGEACGLGLGHLQLSRRLDSLSAGEWQRVQLVACLSGGLMGILYIFDDLGGLLAAELISAAMDRLKRLVARGNTALLLDHSLAVISGADEVWEFVAGAPMRPESENIPGEMPVKDRQLKDGTALVVSGESGVGKLDFALPHGSLNCLTGPSGCGKTRVLYEVLHPLLKGRQVEYEASGTGRNNRVVEIGTPGKRATLLDELGVFAPIADLYAASPAARSRGWGRDAFQLDKPGGRCPSCEGRGHHFFALEFLEDISLVCESCAGRRFRSEIAEITMRGVSIADVLEMSVARASRHFAREQKVQKRLAAAGECGLGYLQLGCGVEALEQGEWLRLRLAVESTRTSGRTWILIDHPASGDHDSDIGATTKALRGLVARGATVVVADQHPAIVAAADWVVDLGR